MRTIPRVRGVRWRPDTGFELRCQSCAERNNVQSYWPLTLEFWQPRWTMQRCRACVYEQKRLGRRASYAADPEPVREKNRAYRRANHDLLAAKAKTRRCAA